MVYAAYIIRIYGKYVSYMRHISFVNHAVVISICIGNNKVRHFRQFLTEEIIYDK